MAGTAELSVVKTALIISELDADPEALVPLRAELARRGVNSYLVAPKPHLDTPDVNTAIEHVRALSVAGGEDPYITLVSLGNNDLVADHVTTHNPAVDRVIFVAIPKPNSFSNIEALRDRGRRSRFGILTLDTGDVSSRVYNFKGTETAGSVIYPHVEGSDPLRTILADPHAQNAIADFAALQPVQRRRLSKHR